jgi:hypothetical protein
LETEFFAAIVGAVVGGAISAALQWQNFKAQNSKQAIAERRSDRAKKDSELQQNVVLAFSVLLKLNRIHTTVTNFLNHIHDGVLHAIRTKMELAGALKAFSSDPEPVEFTIEELALVRSCRNDDVLNALLDSPYINRMYIENAAVLRKMKLELAEIGQHRLVEAGGRFESRCEGAAAGRAQANVFTANVIIWTLYRRSFTDYPLITNLLHDVQRELWNFLGKGEVGFGFEVKRLPDPAGLPRHRY